MMSLVKCWYQKIPINTPLVGKHRFTTGAGGGVGYRLFAAAAAADPALLLLLLLLSMF